MAEDEFYEKLSIRDSVKSLKKYGSTSKHMKRQENLIKHSIVSTDTLQGIALKYGVTTEQIRRINRLWASDSLFLREYLLIPVDNDSLYCNSSENSQNVNSNNNTDTNKITSSISNSEFDEPTIDSFLSNIDTSIANMKKEVKKAQGNSEFIKNTDLDTTYTKQKKHAVSRMRQLSSSSSSGNSTSSSYSLMKSVRNPPDIISNSSTSYQNMTSSQPHTVPMVITQTGLEGRRSTINRENWGPDRLKNDLES